MKRTSEGWSRKKSKVYRKRCISENSYLYKRFRMIHLIHREKFKPNKMLVLRKAKSIVKSHPSNPTSKSIRTVSANLTL